MKDRTLLLSALIACCIHALLMFANFGTTRPDLPSAMASIKVTLLAPPESAFAPAPEPPPPETIEPAVKPEPKTIPESQPAPMLVAEPEPLPVPEPAPAPVAVTRQVVPQASQEPEPSVEPLPAEAPKRETTGPPDSERAERSDAPADVSTEMPESSVRSEHPTPTVDRLPAYTYNPKPAYPRTARRRGQEGTVLLLVEVLATGRVSRIEIEKSSGYELLDGAAVETVRKWRFVPAKRGSVSVRAWVRIPIEFDLRDMK